MEIDTVLSPETVKWTENDRKALTILKAKLTMVRNVKRQDLMALFKEFPETITDDDLVRVLVNNADDIIDILQDWPKDV